MFDPLSGNDPRRSSDETVWIYVNTDALPGDPDYLQAFAGEEAANRWLDENDRKVMPSNIRCRSEGDRIAFRFALQSGASDRRSTAALTWQTGQRWGASGQRPSFQGVG
jgi:hypothetical protein